MQHRCKSKRSDRDYEVLCSEYNRAYAHIQELQAQLEFNEKQWRKLEAKWEVTDDHIRDFCEMILAKNRSEMQLGKAKTWSDYTTDELIARAKTSLIEYLGQRKDVQDKLIQACEDRAREIASLKIQIAYLEQNGTTMAGTEAEQAQDSVNTVQNELFADGGDVADTVVAEHIEKDTAMKKAKEAAASMVTINLEDLTRGFGDDEWHFLHCIGQHGYSKFDDILMCLAPSRTPMDVKKYRGACTILRSAGVIDTITIRLPIAKSLKAIILTSRGKQLYEMTFCEKPVTSEYDRICAEHGNAAHGYGIAELEQILIASNKYASVCSFNRSHPIEVTVLGQTMQYVPDIICKTDKCVEYYEYERGKHTQAEFNAKCDKMCAVTRCLNFVCPNREIVLIIKTQVDKWVDSRGGAKNLRSYTLRITSVQTLRDKQDWWIVYKFSEGAEPVIAKELHYIR